MSAEATPRPAEPAAKSKTPLDDVMIAMDVVDELRHDKDLVERELNDEVRRRDLIERLRQIYKGQGIEVPDHVLEQGVKALEQDRFVYKPPKDTLQTKLARLYVTRDSWGKYAAGGLAAIAGLWLWNYVVNERPRQLETAAITRELKTELPQRLDKALADIRLEAKDAGAVPRAEAVRLTGVNAASSGHAAEARTAVVQLEEMLARLRTEYEIRIVNRAGQLSGLWRVPKAAQNTYNYYLVVEAIDAAGKRLEQTIENEETGQRERVAIWAVRVDRAVLEAVRADKMDDGILQKSVAGRKVRGQLEPTWQVAVSGGAITRW